MHQTKEWIQWRSIGEVQSIGIACILRRLEAREMYSYMYKENRAHLCIEAATRERNKYTGCVCVREAETATSTCTRKWSLHCT